MPPISCHSLVRHHSNYEVLGKEGFIDHQGMDFHGALSTMPTHAKEGSPLICLGTKKKRKEKKKTRTN